MPSKIYYLDAAQTDAGTASWDLFYRNFTLTHNGQPLGVVGAKELKQGHAVPLPDGRTLRVRVQQQFGAQGLDLQVDGQPVPGTVNDPQAQVNTAFTALLFIAVLSTALALFGHVETLEQLGLGWAAIAESLLYVGLA